MNGLAVAATHGRPMAEPRVHEFDSTIEAYGASQTDDTIVDGDVLVVRSEQVVGILLEAWPTAVTVAQGAFHEAKSWASTVAAAPERRASYETAVLHAKTYGFEVR